MSAEAQPFQRRTVAWLVGIGVASLLAGLIWLMLGDAAVPPRSVQADAYSRSAIGQHAFVTLLRAVGTPVLLSRHDSAQRAGRDGLLVLAEPDPLRADPEVFDDLLHGVRQRLGPSMVVLPRWRGWVHPEHGAWIGAVEQISATQVAGILEELDLRAHVARAPGTFAEDAWSTAADLPRPHLVDPQLLRDTRLAPLVWSEAGVLAGWAGNAYDAPILVVSDPSIFSTAGLGNGDNAALAVALVDLAGDDPAMVFWDETGHGHTSDPSVFAELLQFPLLLSTLHGLLAALVAAALAARRFGAPQQLPPAIEPGKAFLIENTAELLQFGGHAGYAVKRYYSDALRDVAAAYRLQPGVEGAALQRWVEELSTRRGTAEDPARLAHEVQQLGGPGSSKHARRLLDLARRIHRWREELVHGSGAGAGHSGHRPA